MESRHICVQLVSTGGYIGDIVNSPPKWYESVFCTGYVTFIQIQAGGIKVQLQCLAVASPMATLTVQEMRDEAMDLRLRANMDFEKAMDLFGDAEVTKVGIRKFLRAWI